jgi:hypothetical protein
VISDELGDSKVRYFDLLPRSNENVRGLDVSMDDAFLMGDLKRICYLDAEIGQFLDTEGGLTNPVAQSTAFE